MRCEPIVSEAVMRGGLKFFHKSHVQNGLLLLPDYSFRVSFESFKFLKWVAVVVSCVGLRMIGKRMKSKSVHWETRRTPLWDGVDAI